jgi:hypothetical protein
MQSSTPGAHGALAAALIAACRALGTSEAADASSAHGVGDPWVLGLAWVGDPPALVTCITGLAGAAAAALHVAASVCEAVSVRYAAVYLVDDGNDQLHQRHGPEVPEPTVVAFHLQAGWVGQSLGLKMA